MRWCWSRKSAISLASQTRASSWPISAWFPASDQVAKPSGAAASPRPATPMPDALVEGAWAYRMKPRIGRHKVDRIEALPKVIRDIGWKAQVRLCTRYRRLRARGKTANVVNVAIAREMRSEEH